MIPRSLPAIIQPLKMITQLLRVLADRVPGVHIRWLTKHTAVKN